MAATDNSPASLLSLEAELTCSICLSTFDCPVTIPCGHNFCRSCLEATWESSTTCPQCRTYFPVRPELKKNTVLSTVVETFSLRSGAGDGGVCAEEKRAEEKRVIRCDTCMEAVAARTCLTCMASYCEDHLRPHRENPIFRPHQLSEPLDLSERICSDHHKLMELYCVLHARSICSLCLQQAHKGCAFRSPEEERKLRESDLRNKLDLLNGKILSNEDVICQMREVHDQLEESANIRKKVLAAEYQQMRDMLTQEESAALNALDREVETGQAKLRDLMKKFTANIDNMSTAKEEIHRLLSQSQSLAFLQVTVNLPQAVNFEPYSPRINLDSKKVMANQAFSAALKEHLTEIFQQPVQARPQVMAGQVKAEPPSRESKNPVSQPKAGQKQQEEKKKQTKKPVESKAKPEPSQIPLNVTTAEKRSELLKYGTELTFDPKTAHKRITLSEGFTKASVSEEHANYPNHPARFTVCSQVLASSGFSKGRHYWEVRLSSHSFVGIGLANRSIDRKGPTSRLGRNPQSWCIEWFHVKLSAWHNSVETALGELNPKRVGVLLDCERGVATFYNVADRAYPFHSFQFPCTEAVLPAFWIFSNESSITLCKLQQ